MASNSASIRRLFDRPEALMIAALTAGVVTLLSAAVIGGRQAEGSLVAAPTTEGGSAAPNGGQPVDPNDLITGPAVGPQSSTGPGGAQPQGSANLPPAARHVTRAGDRVSATGATREGVHADHFEFGVHAPITFDGVPLNLAEDPVTGVKGYVTWINRSGGINGLKMRIFPIDDRYTTAGGGAAADKLVKEIKPFVIEGTLGIDQIAKVAKAAASRNIPYFAGGGPEPEFKDVKMFQLLSNYDQYMKVTADFICKYGPKYVGGTKASDVRLGTTTLNSENILPVEKRFVSQLAARNCVREPVDKQARGTIQKPTEQTTYGDQQLKLRTAYGNQGANLVVPLQDPISTSRQVAEWGASGYSPKWTIANFAHDSDTVLTLMKGSWTGMRVMSGGCYYHPMGGGDPYNASKCAKMGEAHKRWNSLGSVTYDTNAGGSFGGKSSYDYNEANWVADGSGGAAGYQLVFFYYGAMKAIGTDPTREKFVAAMSAYKNYGDAITGPFTFAGSPNIMIGPNEFTLLEAKSNLKWRQVTEITPGLVDHF